MNHMANEFYFEGHEESSAPWRFHEGADGREYLHLGRWAGGACFRPSGARCDPQRCTSQWSSTKTEEVAG